ncbi:unnamed protein product [Thelazia callipaeda]|uniref:TRAUB domain-containing protein n=1 Tax=Thelazia callipaeda TaxID=103827 RepID=A0A0N5CKN3_THECL|nr:unnamed protein product [Thelazia callipaeda]
MSIVDIVKENCLYRSQQKVDNYTKSLLEFGASSSDVKKVTDCLKQKNEELASLLHEVELIENTLKSCEIKDLKEHSVFFEDLEKFVKKMKTEENRQQESGSNTKPNPINTGAVQPRQKRHSLLVSQLKDCLRRVEASDFLSIPSANRGRIGRIELNLLLKKVYDIFSEKYVHKKRSFAPKNEKKQEYESLKGRWYLPLTDLLAKFSPKEKVCWKLALPSLIYLKRLEEIKEHDNIFIAAVLS